MKKLLSFLALVAATACPWCGAAGASDAKTTLVRDVVVNGKSIYLADLLPASSPGAIRIPAQEILVGASPQPGSVRVFASSDIARLLNDANLSSRVTVPEQIVVRRSGHLVTREEVAEAIRGTLTHNRIEGTQEIKPEDIHLSARVIVSAENPDLRVTRIEMDRSLEEMKFWLVSGAEPTLLPFIVMVRPSCDACGSSGMARRLNMETSMNSGSRSGQQTGRHAESAPIYVEAGKIARLHVISGPEMQMDLIAISLERGTLGQTVRAKIQQTGKILSARVVGRDRLEAAF